MSGRGRKKPTEPPQSEWDETVTGLPKIGAPPKKRRVPSPEFHRLPLIPDTPPRQHYGFETVPARSFPRLGHVAADPHSRHPYCDDDDYEQPDYTVESRNPMTGPVPSLADEPMPSALTRQDRSTSQSTGPQQSSHVPVIHGSTEGIVPLPPAHVDASRSSAEDVSNRPKRPASQELSVDASKRVHSADQSSSANQSASPMEYTEDATSAAQDASHRSRLGSSMLGGGRDGRHSAARAGANACYEHQPDFHPQQMPTYDQALDRRGVATTFHSNRFARGRPAISQTPQYPYQQSASNYQQVAPRTRYADFARARSDSSHSQTRHHDTVDSYYPHAPPRSYERAVRLHPATGYPAQPAGRGTPVAAMYHTLSPVPYGVSAQQARTIPPPLLWDRNMPRAASLHQPAPASGPHASQSRQAISPRPLSAAASQGTPAWAPMISPASASLLTAEHPSENLLDLEQRFKRIRGQMRLHHTSNEELAALSQQFRNDPEAMGPWILSMEASIAREQARMDEARGRDLLNRGPHLLVDEDPDEAYRSGPAPDVRIVARYAGAGSIAGQAALAPRPSMHNLSAYPSAGPDGYYPLSQQPQRRGPRGPNTQPVNTNAGSYTDQNRGVQMLSREGEARRDLSAEQQIGAQRESAQTSPEGADESMFVETWNDEDDKMVMCDDADNAWKGANEAKKQSSHHERKHTKSSQAPTPSLGFSAFGTHASQHAPVPFTRAQEQGPSSSQSMQTHSKAAQGKAQHNNHPSMTWMFTATFNMADNIPRAEDQILLDLYHKYPHVKDVTRELIRPFETQLGRGVDLMEFTHRCDRIERRYNVPLHLHTHATKIRAIPQYEDLSVADRAMGRSRDADPRSWQAFHADWARQSKDWRTVEMLQEAYRQVKQAEFYYRGGASRPVSHDSDATIALSQYQPSHDSNATIPLSQYQSSRNSPAAVAPPKSRDAIKGGGNSSRGPAGDAVHQEQREPDSPARPSPEPLTPKAAEAVLPEQVTNQDTEQETSPAAAQASDDLPALQEASEHITAPEQAEPSAPIYWVEWRLSEIGDSTTPAWIVIREHFTDKRLANVFANKAFDSHTAKLRKDPSWTVTLCFRTDIDDEGLRLCVGKTSEVSVTFRVNRKRNAASLRATPDLQTATGFTRTTWEVLASYEVIEEPWRSDGAIDPTVSHTIMQDASSVDEDAAKDESAAEQTTANTNEDSAQPVTGTPDAVKAARDKEIDAFLDDPLVKQAMEASLKILEAAPAQSEALERSRVSSSNQPSILASYLPASTEHGFRVSSTIFTVLLNANRKAVDFFLDVRRKETGSPISEDDIKAENERYAALVEGLSADNKVFDDSFTVGGRVLENGLPSSYKIRVWVRPGVLSGS